MIHVAWGLDPPPLTSTIGNITYFTVGLLYLMTKRTQYNEAGNDQGSDTRFVFAGNILPIDDESV